MCVHVQLVHEDEGIQECLPADVARVRGHTVLQNKAGKGGHAGKRRPRSATCMQILHYACDKTSDSLSSYTETGSMYYTNISTSKPHTEVSKNHTVYRRKVPSQMALAEGSPKTAAAVDHRPEALIATTSQDGRHTHGYHLLSLWPRPLVTISNQDSQLLPTEYIELSKYPVKGIFSILNLQSPLEIKGITQAETRLTPC